MNQSGEEYGEDTIVEVGMEFDEYMRIHEQQNDDSNNDYNVNHFINDSMRLPTSFRDSTYYSDTMKEYIKLSIPDPSIPSGLQDVAYRPSKIFPEWICQSSDWTKTKGKIGNEVSDIIQVIKYDLFCSAQLANYPLCFMLHYY